MKSGFIVLPYVLRNATGHGRGRRLNVNDFLSQPKKVLVTLIRFICSFFSTARRTNQEAPPQLSGACLYSNPPLLLSLRVFLTPPSFGHLPYILRCKTQGRRVNSITPTSGIFNPSPRRYAPQFSPIFSCTTPRNASGHGRGRRLDTNNFLSLPKIVSVALESLFFLP